MKRLFAFVLISLVAFASPSVAVDPDEVLKDPKLEARARALSKELRCLVCQNQSIDDSDAQLAKDLRVLLRERLVAGDSDEQAVTYLVNRFGEFVLLKPRVGAHTLILWFGPFVLLLVGLLFLMRARMKAAPKAVSEAPLDEDEEAALAKLTGTPKND